MRDFWKSFVVSSVVGLGLVATAVLAQSGSIGSSTTIGSGPASSSSFSGTSSFDSFQSSSALDRSLDERVAPRSTLSGVVHRDVGIDEGLMNANSSMSGSIYRDGSLDPFRQRDLGNTNALRYYVNPLGSPYANGNANAYER